ncbi:MAG: hypothetical protein CL693_00235 [Cellvibrionaceae bacterium]|nr:hypothetical protein [Cellvibrionaceae bacterium]|tara:strand:+ start:3575 stop:4696 length:1122 start_codon:yes stop_codon:yes gene_type:complete
MSKDTVSKADIPVRKKKRPLGGGAPQSGKNAPSSSDKPQDALSGAVRALNGLKETDAYLERNKLNTVFLNPKEIKKTFNARFVPCSLDEFASVSWPSLDYDIEAAADLYPALLDSRPWYQKLNDQQKRDFTEFLQQIHGTAQSISAGRQIHPITAEREHAAANEAFIVDGERRTLSVLYSCGAIPYVKAQIFDYMLDEETRARLKDEANDVPGLRDFEVLDSKLARLDANSELLNMTLRPLGKELKLNKDRAAIVKDVAKHPQRKPLFDRIQNERMTWANMRHVLDHGIDAPLPTLAVSNKDKTKTAGKGGVKNDPFGDSLKTIGKGVQGQLGYSCNLKYNAKKDSVKLSLDCPKEKLQELLSLIGYQDEGHL